jgi:hypothetical protein
MGMAHFVFLFSTIHRHFVSLNIDNPPLQFRFSPEPDVHATAKLYLFGGSAFNVEVISSLQDEDPAHLANALLHVMSGLFDALGLSFGRPHNITLEGFTNLETGQSAQLSFALPAFGQDIEAAGLRPQDWIGLCVGNPQLRAALRDIRLAMETPGEVPVHCYRAIERIRQYFARGNNRKRSWETLATALNVERRWLDSYTAHAIAVRHGEIVELKLAERDACLRQAAIVVIRFAAFLKQDGVNLTAPQFPLLS